MTAQEIFRKVRHIEITTKGLVNQIFSGEYHSVFKGQGIEFSEVREYQFGDDIKAIDWNVTARFGHPFVKIFEEERELTVILMVDMSSSQKFGGLGRTKIEIASEISAILAFSALKNNDKVGCMLFTDTIEKFIPPRKNRNHVLRIIREIIAFEPKGKGTNIKASLEFLNATIKRRSIVFLISDYIDAGYEKLLKIAASKHDFISVVVQDPLERSLPLSGLLNIVDPETGRARMIDAASPFVRRTHQLIARNTVDEKKKMFASANVDAVWLESPRDREGFNYLKPLTKFFKQRAKRW
jgi:uncharacterized protein (DUF58 family)